MADGEQEFSDKVLGTNPPNSHLPMDELWEIREVCLDHYPAVEELDGIVAGMINQDPGLGGRYHYAAFSPEAYAPPTTVWVLFRKKDYHE